MTKNLIAVTAAHMEQLFAGEGSGHDWAHIRRVWLMARRLAAALPRGEFRRLEGAPHALNYGRAAEFVAIALEFRGRNPPGASALPPEPGG